MYSALYPRARRRSPTKPLALFKEFTKKETPKETAAKSLAELLVARVPQAEWPGSCLVQETA